MPLLILLSVLARLLPTKLWEIGVHIYYKIMVNVELVVIFPDQTLFDFGRGAARNNASWAWLGFGMLANGVGASRALCPHLFITTD